MDSGILCLLISQSTILLRLIDIECISILLLFVAEWYFTVWIYHVDGNVGSFKFCGHTLLFLLGKCSAVDHWPKHQCVFRQSGIM